MVTKRWSADGLLPVKADKKVDMQVVLKPVGQQGNGRIGQLHCIRFGDLLHFGQAIIANKENN